MVILRLDSKPPRLSIVKPLYEHRMPVLDRARLLENAVAKRETVLALDTNVLGQINELVHRGGHYGDLAQLGLDQLLQVLTQPDYRTLVIAAGQAFQELPGALLHQFHDAYEWFLSRYVPGFYDHPLALPPRLSTPRADEGFWDRTQDAQVAFSLSYSLLLLLQAVCIDGTEKNHFARFRRFIDLVTAEVDVLSAKEIEIARWCLSPAIDEDEAYGKRRKRMIQNFARIKGRRPRSITELRRIALNGTHDLWFITSAMYLDVHGLCGIAQDTWIATFDDKLAEYCNYFNYVPAGALTGAFAASECRPSAFDPGYWKQTEAFLEPLRMQRMSQGAGRRYSEDAERLELVRRCESMLDGAAGPPFVRSRPTAP